MACFVAKRDTAAAALLQRRLSGGMDFQCSFVYPYPSVSALAGGHSDHGPRKTRTKTQTSPDSVFTGERRNSDHGLSFGCFWGRGRRGGSLIRITKLLQMKMFGQDGMRSCSALLVPIQLESPHPCLAWEFYEEVVPSGAEWSPLLVSVDIPQIYNAMGCRTDMILNQCFPKVPERTRRCYSGSSECPPHLQDLSGERERPNPILQDLLLLHSFPIHPVAWKRNGSGTMSPLS